MSKFKVLIVDDEVFFRSIVGDWVTSWGHEAVLAASGMEAVTAVKNDKFDIIILDYLMPQMDGLATLKQIRKIAPDVAVIMFSGHPTGETIGGTEKLGVISFVTKLSLAVDIQNALKSLFSMIERKLKGRKHDN
jgi:DNA-binding NtrC family response regulator